MKKLVRILGLIQQIRNKKKYPASIRRQLISTLLFLEYQYFIRPHDVQLRKRRILNYTVESYGYGNLCILFREIFIEEEYQYFNSKSIKPVIIDCGANIGMATLYLKWKFPESVIHAFEPDPTAFSLLSKNVRNNNLKDVHLYNHAAMTKNGTIDFYVSDNSTASLMMSTLKERMNQHKISVEGIDFPLFIEKNSPGLMKMDIEGAENELFVSMDNAGCFRSLEEIILEYHHLIEGRDTSLSSLLHILEKNNYEYNLITRFDKPGTFQDILIYARKKD
jgi:FkbM family methyltransferase